jgi:hypothetical protein
LYEGLVCDTRYWETGTVIANEVKQSLWTIYSGRDCFGRWRSLAMTSRVIAKGGRITRHCERP